MLMEHPVVQESKRLSQDKRTFVPILQDCIMAVSEMESRNELDPQLQYNPGLFVIFMAYFKVIY